MQTYGVQLHASTSVHMLKIWHKKIQHMLIGMGSAALVAAVPYTHKATQKSCKGQWSTVFCLIQQHANRVKQSAFPKNK